MKYTPGPWKASYKNVVSVKLNTVIAQCWETSLFDDPPIQLPVQANARLIAAAPALLEACDLAYRWLKVGPDDPVAKGVSLMELINRLGQALAAARQEEASR